MANSRRRLVLCLRNTGYEVSLERRKIYATIPDADAVKHRQIRVIDESGDDYLYPAAYFTLSNCRRQSVGRYWPRSNTEWS